jgi:hypothetical protein
MLQFTFINNQTFKGKIHWHLVNNNPNMKHKLSKIVSTMQEQCKPNVQISVANYENKNFGFERFYYIKQHILPRYICDYVIIIDDDQLYPLDWVQNMWCIRQPFIYSGWYNKRWTNKQDIKYWIKNRITSCQPVHYIGTGGCIIDTIIFQSDSILWDLPKDIPHGVTVLNIEDLWLSSVAKRCGYTLQSHNYVDISKNKLEAGVALCQSLTKEKQVLLEYLCRKYHFVD